MNDEKIRKFSELLFKSVYGNPIESDFIQILSCINVAIKYGDLDADEIEVLQKMHTAAESKSVDGVKEALFELMDMTTNPSESGWRLVYGHKDGKNYWIHEDGREIVDQELPSGSLASTNALTDAGGAMMWCDGPKIEEQE